MTIWNSQGCYQEAEVNNSEKDIEHLVKRALELGAEKAKLIDVNTVVIEEWVRWKCQYGCPFYEKDGFHPPFAPDVESTKKVFSAYSKAIILNGAKVPPLSDAAINLEGEAYRKGYYKAFALVASFPGPAGAG